jgi:hypothetical protein
LSALRCGGANKVLDVNQTENRASRGGRPVANPLNWLSGVLDCPECGGNLYINSGLTTSGNPRTPTLRCAGQRKTRVSCKRFPGAHAQRVTGLISAMFASDPTEILAFQRVTGNAHELDALKAELSRVQGRLSATEDDDELDGLIAERKAMKARIEAFEVTPDSYDYAPTGQTVGQMWEDGDDKVKRAMVRAVKKSWGMTLVSDGGEWLVDIKAAGPGSKENPDGIIDLGNGLCFRR